MEREYVERQHNMHVVTKRVSKEVMSQVPDRRATPMKGCFGARSSVEQPSNLAGVCCSKPFTVTGYLTPSLQSGQQRNFLFVKSDASGGGRQSHIHMHNGLKILFQLRRPMYACTSQYFIHLVYERGNTLDVSDTRAMVVGLLSTV
jgi:hypothetical protein